MTPEDLEKFNEAVKDNPQVSKELLSQLAKAATKGGGRAYYSRQHANQFIPLVDHMLANPGLYHKLLFADYPQWSPNSIIQRVHDATRYLADYDTTADKRYQNWYTRTSKSVFKDEFGNKIGVLFSRLGNFDLKVHPLSEEEVARIEKQNAPAIEKKLEQIVEIKPPPTWRQAVIDFINGTDPRPNIKLQDLKLTDQDIKDCEELFENSNESFTAMVRPNLIVAIRGKLEENEA